MKSLILPVLLLVAVLALAGCTTPDQTASDARDEEAEDQLSMAWVMAQDFVEQNLKSPGTASYGSVWKGDWQSTDDCVKDLGDNKYRATGWVDSQNAFGATVRIDFVCELEYVGNDKWRCTDIEMNQR